MIIAIVFLPLFAAILVGLRTSAISNKSAQIITSLFVSIAAILSYIVFYQTIILKQNELIHVLNFIHSGDFLADWNLKVDSLTAVMLVLVTTVSALVHIYSIEYMSHDKHIPRFMSYLSLFTFSMLMLVTSNNFMQMFFGWEGVGLCSYLLIGFWYKKDSARAAAIKAFVVNRVGDFAFILGIFTIYYVFKTLAFDEIFSLIPSIIGNKLNLLGFEVNSITLICILLFIGAMGKSAQFGLHTWLPDAMEGPTPVSALIHAATMVTAGIFLVARMSPLYEHSLVARDMVTLVGGFTALFAATIAITQNDIKRIIAYSTCSQLGYMFFACGVSAYGAGIFHLLTHGFFKALLFLCAGSVIHAMSNEQDIRKMGGIYKKIPFTYVMMLIGTIAIVGFPPFSGYFSKDMILESAYAVGSKGNKIAMFAFISGLITAVLTSFYSWRLIFVTFHGVSRADEKVLSHIHESPKMMTIPLLILSIGAVFVGGILYKYFGIIDHNMKFWNESLSVSHHTKHVIHMAHHLPLYIKLLPLVAGIIGLSGAFVIYIMQPKLAVQIATNFSPFYKFSLNKWYIDELYNVVFVKPLKSLSVFFSKNIDTALIDRLGPNGVSFCALKLSGVVSRLQNGLIYVYAFAMIIGLASIMGYFIWF